MRDRLSFTQVVCRLFHLILQFSVETKCMTVEGSEFFCQVATRSVKLWEIFQHIMEYFPFVSSSSLLERGRFSNKLYHFPRCKISQDLMLDFLFMLMLSSIPINTKK